MWAQQKGIKIPAKDDYFTSTTYDTYENAISEVQKYVTENYNGNEFAGLIEIKKECANKDIDGEEWCGFIYTATFDINNDGRYNTLWDGSLISQNDIILSTYHPEIPSLIFSPDIDEYCIILNGQILNPIRK